MFDLEQLTDRIKRLTFPLPTKPWHVHGYLLRDDDGTWTLVDTGLAVPGLEERLAELDVPIARIVVTHFHPDHVGGAQQAHDATGAPVYQGALDYEQCEHVWGNPRWPEVIAGWFRVHGVPEETLVDVLTVGSAYAPFIRYVRDPEPLAEGDEIAGWEVLQLPGHADGHLALHRDGELVAGDTLLSRISPAVGLYPDSRPDPLGDFLDSLRRIEALAPRIAYPGHNDPIDDPGGRARELLEHHRVRLDATADALRGAPRTAYEVSLDVFGAELSPGARRFAVAETLSHLVRLAAAGRAERLASEESVRWAGL